MAGVADEKMLGDRHPHSLFLKIDPVQFSCARCKLEGIGRRYQCKEKKCEASLHEICTTCPEYIASFLHPQHRLTLQLSYNPLTIHTCEACGERVHGYFYRCKPCSFELHPSCSVHGATVCDPSHPVHLLTFQPRGTTTAATGSPCAVCDKMCDDVKHGGTYCCASGCTVQVHVRCLSTAAGCSKVPPDAEQQTAGRKATRETKNSNNHCHDLSLMQNSIVYNCHRCKCPGYGRRYVCKGCQINFHDICATCPESTSFFMHPQHPLFLIRSHNPFSKHTCKVCDAPTHGYFYRCKDCDFQIHPFCSFLQPTITDGAHPNHTLRYISEGEERDCSVCGEGCDMWRYSCEECGAKLHMRCLQAAGQPKMPAGVLLEGVKGDGSKRKKVKQALKIAAFNVINVATYALGVAPIDLLFGEDKWEDGNDDNDNDGDGDEGDEANDDVEFADATDNVEDGNCDAVEDEDVQGPDSGKSTA